MPKNRPLPNSEPESIEAAWAAGDEVGMVRAVVRKYARVLDMTDSGRDIKPLATGMFEAVDKLHAMESARGGKVTPLTDILNKAKDVSAAG